MKHLKVPKFEPVDEAERTLLAIEDLSHGIAHDEEYANAPEKCDLCGVSLEDRRFMVDGNTEPGGCLWACMCAKCALRKGEGIGWGKGQLYTQLEPGRWLMTAGFPPGEGE
jgi:hypothetical protein